MTRDIVAVDITPPHPIMMVKAEVLKYLMHFRDLEPENILNKTVAYLKTVNHQNREIANL